MASRRGTPRPVVVVAYEGVLALDVTGPHEVFAAATGVLTAPGRPRAGYDVSIASLTPGPVRSPPGRR
jgi:putative intracellular protease/amidase